MSNNQHDESAARLFEATYFQPGSMYGSKADYFRDVKMQRYRTDEAFRTLVNQKLAYSMQNNPNFDTPTNPSDQKPMSVAVSRDKAGNIHSEVSSTPGVHTHTSTAASDDGRDANGVKIIREADGRVTASLAMSTARKPAAVRPMSTGVSVKTHPDQR